MNRAALAIVLGLAGHGAALAQIEVGQDSAPVPCVLHADAMPGPAFPREAARAGVFGRVLAVLHFDAPDRPPTVDLFHRPRAAMLATSVRTWAQGLRMPCHAGARHTEERAFSFRYGAENPRFRDLRLPDLLALSRHADDRQPFDTAGMRCPVQVAWTYRQPQRPNGVHIEGEPDPAHAPVIERLVRLDLALSPVASDIAWGATARFEIPCHPPETQPKE